MVAVLAVSTEGVNNFFGIPILAEPKDDVNAIIQNLINSDYDKAGQHLKHLATTAPRFAGTIKLSDFTIPCADCAAEKDPACAECSGKLKVVDPHSLRYLQYKFETALEDDETVEKAWSIARKAFDIRKKQVPGREVFQGRIIKIDQDAFLVEDDGEVFYLMGCVTSGWTVGQPFVGYRWPLSGHSHTYKDSKGKSRTVKSFTLNLWWDY
jgi:hypothetical protein